MAGYRQIHTKIWKDEYIIELDPLEKLLWIYLFSNELTSISGIYKIPPRVIANETGLELQVVEDTLSKFERDGKIAREDGYIWIVKMQEYHSNASPTTMKKVLADIRSIPENNVKKKYLEYYKGIDTLLIPTPYPTDTNSYKAEDKDKDKAEDKDKTEAESGGGGLPSTFTELYPALKPRNEVDQATWTAAYLRMNANGVTPAIMRRASRELADKRMKVASPASLEKPCLMVMQKDPPRKPDSAGAFKEFINH